MEPRQGSPQHIPSPARHHTHHYHHNSSISTSTDKRLLRRSTAGAPYPQSTTLPPLSYSPALSTRSSNSAINSSIPPPHTPTTPNVITASVTTPLAIPASPFTPPPPQLATPRTPTSSLARRRRSTVSSNPTTPNSAFPSPDSMAMPPPSLNSMGSEGTLRHSKQPQTASSASTPCQSSSASSFWASGSTDANIVQGSSLFVKDDMGIGGSWIGWSTVNKNNIQRTTEEPEDRELELQMEEAMEEDSDPEEKNAQQAINTQLNGSATRDSNDYARRQAEDSLSRIAQAMTLLSLAPAGNPPQIQYTTGPHHSNHSTADSEPPWPPHPTPESLLRESLRQSFEAYRILKELDKKFVMGGIEARQKSVSSPTSRRQSLKNEVEEGETNIVDVLRAYDRAAEGVKSAREVLKWAEHWIREEGERARDRLLKG